MFNGSRKLEGIPRNIGLIKERVSRAAEKSGRKPEDITILAVTKTVGADRIREAINEGLADLGENRVQELIEKYPEFDDSVRWHLIGHLQTNKVKYIIDKVKMIHSLDRIELAEEINKRAEKLQKTMDVLVQINVARENTKFGIDPGDAVEFVKRVAQFKNVKVKGLMTIAPFVEDPETIRWVFSSLRKISVDMSKEKIDNISMDYLSMGMSNDFETAIEEGANIVRIGTDIFGSR